jgi:hypothetical protein
MAILVNIGYVSMSMLGKGLEIIDYYSGLTALDQLMGDVLALLVQGSKR